MNRCLKFHKVLNLFLSGDLDESRSRGVRLHLAECDCCRKHVCELEESQQALAVLREPALSCAADPLWPELAPRIARLGHGQNEWTGWFPVGLLAAACFAVYVWGTVSWDSLQLRSGGGPSVTTHVATGVAPSSEVRAVAPTEEWAGRSSEDAQPVLPGGRAVQFRRKPF